MDLEDCFLNDVSDFMLLHIYCVVHKIVKLGGGGVRIHLSKSKPESKLSYNRQSVGQSVLVSGHHLGLATNLYFFSMEIIGRYLRFFKYGAPSLMRGRVCNLLIQVLLGLASPVTLGSKSHKT
jgi:hypothetical protein